MQTWFKHSILATLLKSFVALSSLLPCASTLASELGFVNNEVFIEEEDYDGPLPLFPLSISANGVVDPLQNLSTTGGLDLPRFVFRLDFNDIDDGNYQFATGFIIDEIGSARRIEINIPGMVITISDNGATLTGTIADDQDIAIYARLDANTEATTQIAGTGVLKFEGASAKLIFDARALLRTAAQSRSSLAGFINSLDSAGKRYNYTLVLQQLDAQNNPVQDNEILFGNSPGPRFKPFPSSRTTDFQLFNRALANQFRGGNRIGGTVSFASFIKVQCPQGQVPITNALGENQSCVDMGSRPAFTLYDLESDLMSQISIVEARLSGGRARNNAVNNLISQTSALLDEAIVVLGDPAFRNQEGVEAFDAALSRVMGFVDQNLANGGRSDASAISSMLVKASDLLSVLGSRAVPLTIEETETASSSIRNSINSLRGIFQSQRLEQQLPVLAPGTGSGQPASDQMSVLTGQSELAFTTSVLDSIARAVNANVALGIRIDSILRESLIELSEDALALVLDDIAGQVGLDIQYSDSATTRGILEDYPQLISAALSVVGVRLEARSGLDETRIQTRLRNSGMNAPAAGALASLLSSYTNPEDIVLFSTLKPSTAADFLSTALGKGARIYFDARSSVTVLRYPGMDRPVNITRVDLVSSSFPTGVIDLPDGSLYVAADNTASIALPALANIFNFVALVNNNNGGLALTSDATLRINTDSSLISGILPFSGVRMNHARRVDIEILEPDISDPTDSRYEFKMTYGKGGEQALAPYFNDPAFFAAIEAEGFDYSIDRATGIITVSGSQFRPDYFVTIPDFYDLLYRSQIDSQAVAFRPVDMNNDGITDYRVIIGNTVQVVYGLPMVN